MGAGGADGTGGREEAPRDGGKAEGDGGGGGASDEVQRGVLENGQTLLPPPLGVETGETPPPYGADDSLLSNGISLTPYTPHRPRVAVWTVASRGADPQGHAQALCVDEASCVGTIAAV